MPPNAYLNRSPQKVKSLSRGVPKDVKLFSRSQTIQISEMESYQMGHVIVIVPPQYTHTQHEEEEEEERCMTNTSLKRENENNGEPPSGEVAGWPMRVYLDGSKISVKKSEALWNHLQI